jgi:hypothetical protein
MWGIGTAGFASLDWYGRRDKAKSQFLNLYFEPFLSHHFVLLLLSLFSNTTEGILREYGSLWNP